MQLSQLGFNKIAKLQKFVQTGKIKKTKDILHFSPDERSKAVNAKFQEFMKKNPNGTVGEFLKTLEKTAKVYNKPIETKTTVKKRLFRPDKKIQTEVIKPEVALSMKNTGFDAIRKAQNIKLDYASTDTLKTPDPSTYTVTHRYLGTNPLIKSFKYKESVTPKGNKTVGGSYDLEKNIAEAQKEIRVKQSTGDSSWGKAKKYIGSWFK